MENLTGFAKIKWEVGQIQFAYLGMNEARTAIEANPATHRIAIHIQANYIPRPEHEAIINGLDEGAEMVYLKKVKETEGETEVYLNRKPKAWQAAKIAVEAFGTSTKQ